MSIRFRNIVLAGALVGATTLVTSQVMSRQHDAEMADMEAMMEAWAKLAQPGPEHYELMKLSGIWHQTNKHWTMPGAPPEESETIATFRPILGGRFMMEEIKGEMSFGGEPVPFEGLGIFGYDNGSKKHFFTWVDNMGTMMMTGQGTKDAEGRIVYHSEFPNPVTGEMMKMKSITWMDGDKSIFEMHEKTPDGWRKGMEVTSVRPE